MIPSGKRCTVIMRSMNSEGVIGQALAALFSQEYDDFELLVVDSGSTDGTLDVVSKYPHRLMTIAAGEYFPGAVLNRAARQASGEVLVFQNSDCVPLTPRALGTLVAALDEPGGQAAYARQVPRPEARPWVRREYEAAFPGSGDGPSWITLSLPFAALRRSAWEAHPFYTDAWGSEDTEWGHWARSNGHEVRYVPEALVMHSHNYSLGQLYGRRFIEGEADAFIFGSRDGPSDFARRVLSRTARDWLADLKAGQLADLPVAPVRQWVGAWAYFRGNRMGNRRRDSGDGDAGQGQQVALDHHDSKG